MSLKSKIIAVFFIAFAPVAMSQYLIKLSPTQAILSNEFGLAFEHRIRSKISSEIQLGATYAKDIVPLEALLEKRFHNNTPSHYGWGVYGALSMRYYFVGYNVAPAGFYLGTLYKYRLFNVAFEDKVHTNTTMKGSNGQFILQGLFGYQFPFTKVFSMDFYLGLGAAFQTERIPTVELQNANYGWTTNKIKRTTFAPSIGVKLGFGKSGKELL